MDIYLTIVRPYIPQSIEGNALSSLFGHVTVTRCELRAEGKQYEQDAAYPTQARSGAMSHESYLLFGLGA